jgi:hypothetical protein
MPQPHGAAIFQARFLFSFLDFTVSNFPTILPRSELSVQEVEKYFFILFKKKRHMHT